MGPGAIEKNWSPDYVIIEFQNRKNHSIAFVDPFRVRL